MKPKQVQEWNYLWIGNSFKWPELTLPLSWCLSFKWVFPFPFFTLPINSVRSLLFEHSKETDDFESTLQNDYVHNFTTKIARQLVMRRRKDWIGWSHQFQAWEERRQEWPQGGRSSIRRGRTTTTASSTTTTTSLAFLEPKSQLILSLWITENSFKSKRTQVEYYQQLFLFIFGLVWFWVVGTNSKFHCSSHDTSFPVGIRLNIFSSESASIWKELCCRNVSFYHDGIFQQDLFGLVVFFLIKSLWMETWRRLFIINSSFGPPRPSFIFLTLYKIQINCSHCLLKI